MDVNVGFRMTVTSFVTSLYLTASFGAVLHLSCPTTFSLTDLNDITSKIDIAGLAVANCDFSNRLGFSFREKGSQTPSTLAICPYPPSSCVNNVAANDCGCTRQDVSFYVYTFKFLANETNTGGQFNTSLCVNPKGPPGSFDVAVDESCTDISFANRTNLGHPDYYLLFILLVLLGVAAAILITFCCFNRRCRRLYSCCSCLPTKACGCFLCCMACWNCWCNERFCKNKCSCCAKCCCNTAEKLDMLKGASRTCIGCDKCCCRLTEVEVEEYIRIGPDHELPNANPKDDINSSKKKKERKK